MSESVKLWAGDRWVQVELPPDDHRDREPGPRSTPTLRTYAVRNFRSDPKVTARVLDWLAGGAHA